MHKVISHLDAFDLATSSCSLPSLLEKSLSNAFFVTFFHVTDFYRPAEAIMSLEVVIHLNCSSWWYSASKEYDWGETEPAKPSHQLTIGKGCLCQVPVPCSYHIWILLFFSFFVLTDIGCTVKVVWQCRTVTLCPGQNKEQRIMEAWSSRGSSKWQTAPWNSCARGTGCPYIYLP